jgi:TolA-binding protein
VVLYFSAMHARCRPLLALLFCVAAIAACQPVVKIPAAAPAPENVLVGAFPDQPPPKRSEGADAEAASSAGTATSSLAIPARDPRLARGVKNRPRDMLLMEIQSLESLFLATSRAAPDRPSVARRLADTYAELGRVTDEAAAHRSSAKYYALIATEYPQVPLDEVLYYCGLEHEIAGDTSNARRVYYQIIQQYPSSPLIPFAFFGFGEMFLAEAAIDPSKDDYAKQAYEQVLKTPVSPLRADARRRLAEIGKRAKHTQPSLP